VQGYSKETFGKGEQEAFRGVLAKVVHTLPEFIFIQFDGQTQRHLLAESSVDVRFIITSIDINAAMSVQTSVKSISSVELITEFKAAGLNDIFAVNVTVLQPMELITKVDVMPMSIPKSPPPNPPPLPSHPPYSAKAYQFTVAVGGKVV